MKLTKSKLKHIIQEELKAVLDEFQEPRDSVGNCTKGCIAQHTDFLNPAQNAVALAQCVAACVKNDPTQGGTVVNEADDD